MKPRFKKARYRSEIRSIPIKASDGSSGREITDKGNFFRCWHCGFICDVRRDELSKDGRRGNSVSQETPLQSDRLTNYGMGSDFISLDPGVGVNPVLIHQLADGTSVTVYRLVTPIVVRGCPLCGTTVYKK